MLDLTERQVEFQGGRLACTHWWTCLLVAWSDVPSGPLRRGVHFPWSTWGRASAPRGFQQPLTEFDPSVHDAAAAGEGRVSDCGETEGAQMCLSRSGCSSLAHNTTGTRRCFSLTYQHLLLVFILPSASSLTVPAPVSLCALYHLLADMCKA